MANVVVMEPCLSRCHTKTYMAGMFDSELLKGQLFTLDFFCDKYEWATQKCGLLRRDIIWHLQSMMNAKLTQALPSGLSRLFQYPKTDT